MRCPTDYAWVRQALDSGPMARTHPLRTRYRPDRALAAAALGLAAIATAAQPLPPEVDAALQRAKVPREAVDAYLHVSRFRETFADLGRVVVPR